MAAVASPNYNEHPPLNLTRFTENKQISIPTSNKFTLRALRNKNGKYIIGKKGRIYNRNGRTMNESRQNKYKDSIKKESNILDELSKIPCMKYIVGSKGYINDELFTNYKLEGDLFSYIFERNKKINEPDMIQLFIDICSGVQCLHVHHYFHLDLKFENILVEIDRNTRKIKPLLTDFETTQYTDNNQITITDTNPTIGTIGFLDPVLYAQLSRRKSGEIIQLDGFRIDLYALCFILYSMLIRYKYNSTTYSSILFNMLENALGRREDYDNLSQLISTFQSIINHTPFVTTYASKTIDDVTQLLLDNMVYGFLYENGFDPTIKFNLGGIPPIIRTHIILGIGSDQRTFYDSLMDVMRSIKVKQLAPSTPPPPPLLPPSTPPPPPYSNTYRGNNRGGTRRPKKRTHTQKTKTRQ